MKTNTNFIWLKKHLKEARSQAEKVPFFYQYYKENEPDTCLIASDPQHRGKNYHPDVALPFDHNRILSINEYINASPMRFGDTIYIAAQGPRNNTKEAFWKMVWHEGCDVIVSVTDPHEGKGAHRVHKFDPFWSQKGEAEDVGPLHIETVKEEYSARLSECADERLCIRHLKVSDGKETRRVMHLHLENWPDDGVVDPESLLHLHKEVEAQHRGGPIVVHCAAGIGRTGTFIATHSLIHDMERLLKKASIDKTEFNIVDRVYEMRKQRYGAMVCWPKQYLLIIDTLERALEELK